MACSCRIPRLKNFFGFMSLETGSLIIAWLYVISSIVELVVVSILYPYAIDYITKELANSTDPTDKQNEEMQVYMAKVVVDILIALLSFGVAINTMLLLGIYKRNRCLMMPWILLFGCSCLLGFVFGLITLVTSFYSFDAIMSAVLLYIPVVWQIYVFLVIYSFYAELNAQRRDNESTPLSKSGSSYQSYSVLT